MKKLVAMLHEWFQPNHVLGSVWFRIMLLFQVGLFLFVWQGLDYPLLPKPGAVVAAWWHLATEDTLLIELATSLTLCFEATALTVVLSLLLVYAGVMPFFRPWMTLFSKFRFNGLVGLTLFFTVFTAGTHELKLALLTFSMTVWFVTMMAEEIRQIPVGDYEYARTIARKEWRVVWEVVVMGKLDRVVEVLAQNTAISWLMLTTVEGMVKTEGGIGAMLVIQNKTMRMDEVLAIQLTILLVGMSLDWTFRSARRVLFPHVFLNEANGR